MVVCRACSSKWNANNECERDRKETSKPGVHGRIGSAAETVRDSWNAAGGSGKVRSEAHGVIHVQGERVLGLRQFSHFLGLHPVWRWSMRSTSSTWTCISRWLILGDPVGGTTHSLQS